MAKKSFKQPKRGSPNEDASAAFSHDEEPGSSTPDPINRREFVRLTAFSTASLAVPLLSSCGGSGENTGVGGSAGYAGWGGGPAGWDGGPAGAGGQIAGVGGVPAGGEGGLGGTGGDAAGTGGSAGATGGIGAEGGTGGGGGTAGTAGTGGDGGGGGTAGQISPPAGGSDVIFARYDSQQAATADAAVRLVLSEMDFSWLSAGDSVFIKVACNSGNPHPAVTSPQAVSGMVAELFARGAGRVVVGDKAGVEWVTLFAGEQRVSSTRQMMQNNGLLPAIEQSGAEAHFFDDQGFDAGYFQATPPPQNNWPRGLWLPNIVQQVDHIIYMPRLGYHILAGCTLALKCAVGWLRDDSRHDLHVDAANFYAKYTEVNYVNEIRSRYRMTVSLSEQLLLHDGPDVGTVYTAQPPIVIASANIANHDAVAVGTLLHYASVTPGAGGYNPASAGMLNSMFPAIVPGWSSSAPSSSLAVHSFEQNLSGDGALTRAWQLEGGRPASIRVLLRGVDLDAALQGFLETHGEGMYQFTT